MRRVLIYNRMMTCAINTAETLLSIYDKLASDQMLQYRMSGSSKFKSCLVVKMLTFFTTVIKPKRL